MATTVKEIADELGVPVTLVKNYLRENGFASGSRDFRGAETSLDRREVQALREAAARGELKRDRTKTEDLAPAEREPDPAVSSSDLERFTTVVASSTRLVPKGDAAHAVFLHVELIESLIDAATPDPIRRAFTRRAQELMAHGRATRTKGVRGTNAGWLRVPLGGNSGSHYYLWLLNHGERVAGQDTVELYATLPTGARLLRAVRHHDETRDRLAVGAPDDYVPIEARALLFPEARDGLSEPLVHPQQRAVDDRARVRLLLGQPGAGKTTSLQAATRTLTGRALYLTWNEHLAERAREWLRVYAPADLQVTVWTFRQLLANVDPSGAADLDHGIARGVRLLRERLDPLGRRLGPWWRDGRLRAEELFCELHAHLYGAALPVAFRDRAACGEPCLSDLDYLAARREAIGPAAEAALVAARRLEPADVSVLFPGPVAAFDRARRLQRAELELDRDLFAFEWVLVDEIQDLTLVEQWLVIDVTARAGASAQRKPGVIVAGDEAQTVRPTAFEWGPLSDLLMRRLGTAKEERAEHELIANLRSPHDIALVINQARRALYGTVDKRQRPRGRVEEGPADATVGRILQVAAEDEQALRTVLRMFAASQGDAALVYPGATVPEDVERLAREEGAIVWTSESVKGLEFRVVGVLDVPDEIERIERLASAADREPLSGELARSAIDRFLVALSRTTETLVLLARVWDARAMALANRILAVDPQELGAADAELEGNLGVVSRTDLGELLEVDAADARERIEALLLQSEQLGAQGRLDDAVRLARNAVGLLGKSGRPGAAGKELRERARRRLGQTLALSGIETRSRDELGRAAHEFRAAGRPGVALALRALATALFGDPAVLETHKALASTVQALGPVADAEAVLLDPIVRALRQRLEWLASDAPVPDTPKGREALIDSTALLAKQAPSDRAAFARAHDALVLRILRFLAPRPEHAREYRALRPHLTDGRDAQLLDAQHAEACSEFATAAITYEELGELADALRCYRQQPDLKSAARIAATAASGDAAILGWAAELEDVLARRPAGSLREPEADALRSRFEHHFRRDMPSRVSSSSKRRGR